MIPRELEKILNERMGKGKIIIILGPRQSGKTTIMRDLAEKRKEKTLWWNGDEPDMRQMLPSATSKRLKELIGTNELLIIDEAQRIENIGLVLKLISDNIKTVQVIASGSSAFDLANKLNEPLTGRKFENFLFPLSYSEMATFNGEADEKRLLENRLIFGSYPEIVTSPGQETERLTQLADSYLYKDIFTWERVLKPDRLERLVQAIAFQIGNEVSYLELGQTTGLDKETVEKYIMLLEKAFVIFRLGSFSRTLRKELKKSRKIYFYDNGIRNAVIKNFNLSNLRADIGALWENYLISERMKMLHYTGMNANRYFWRTHDQQEIDYIEDRGGRLFAYEFKWNKNAKVRFPKPFMDNYPGSSTELITPENYSKFLTAA